MLLTLDLGFGRGVWKVSAAPVGRSLGSGLSQLPQVLSFGRACASPCFHHRRFHSDTGFGFLGCLEADKKYMKACQSLGKWQEALVAVDNEKV